MTKQARYWDLTEEEKEALSRESLDAYFAVERMERGVLLPEPIVLQVEDVPVPPTRTMYRPSGPGRYGSNDSYPFAFDTMAEAEAFLKLNPRGIAEDWHGSKIPYTFSGNRAILSVSPAEVTTEAEHNKISDLAQKAEKASESNRKAREEHDKGRKAADQAVESILADFEAVQVQKRSSERIRATYADYLRLAGGNVTTAMAFLQKAFPDTDQVRRALGDQAYIVAQDAATITTIP